MLEKAEAIAPGKCRHMQMDVTNDQQIKDVFAEAVDWMGGLDGFINCAANENQVPAELLTRADIEPILDCHITGMMLTSAEAFKYMKDNGGSIVQYSSFAGVCGMPDLSVYSAAKAAVLGYMREACKSWGFAGYKMRMNAVCPFVNTEISGIWWSEQTPEQHAANEAYFKMVVPLGGVLGDVKECAYLNSFLSSERSSFIYGQTIGCDGGMTMTR